MKSKKKLTWFVFYMFAAIILILNKQFTIKSFRNLYKELHELAKKRSKFTEDGDYKIIKKRKK